MRQFKELVRDQVCRAGALGSRRASMQDHGKATARGWQECLCGALQHPFAGGKCVVAVLYGTISLFKYACLNSIQ